MLGDDLKYRQYVHVITNMPHFWIFQEPILFSCSIAENIAYGAEDPSTVTAEEIQKVAEIANAASFIRDFPKGFDTVVGEKGILLSGTFSFY